MRRFWIKLAISLAMLVAAAVCFWFGALYGWFGSVEGPGEITGKVLPAEVVAARGQSQKAAAPAGDDSLILFGDLHVHTTLSVDAFQFSLPILGGQGAYPLSDACDFARYCSAMDFWASTDHAESITAQRWKMIKDAVRSCQKVAGDTAEPDLVSFIGFEWTQVGRTPDTHFGHKNVIFRDLEDDKVSKRAIAALGRQSSRNLSIANNMSPLVPLRDFPHRQRYFDYNRFISDTREAEMCPLEGNSADLPESCMEYATTPGELARKLFDEQKLQPLIIPHGTTWGFYTPAGTSWYKSLHAENRPQDFRLIELFSGHGNSEEYRSWDEVIIASDGSKSCPNPAPGYTPACWRAGELIEEHCLKAGIAADECTRRATKARQDYVNMGIMGHLALKGDTPADWTDSGQCTDCFLPAFNFRPKTSVQAGLAASWTDDKTGQQTRFNWGFIGSSDNHRARPGTGYKQYQRRMNTEATGPSSDGWQNLIFPADKWDDENPESSTLTDEEIAKIPGLRTVEAERQAAFLVTGGLAAVHAPARTREAIFDAMQRRETYATSGQKILLWFNATDGKSTKVPMGSGLNAKTSPTFTVKAAGAFKQKPGCPDFAKAGLDEARLTKLCGGECDNPSDERAKITRIEVVKIRPQKSNDEPVAPLVQDRFIVHQCEPAADGTCTFTFTDPSYAKDGRDALYYVKAIQEAQPTINADPLKCERDASGKCVKVNLCYGDYRSGASDCLAPAEPRAWSSPIYLTYR